MPEPRRLVAELLGTFWLVLGGCGTAVLATGVVADGLSVGILGVSLAFGLTVLTGAYAFGAISGGHFNPAVTIGLIVAKRFDAKDALGYIVAQILGAILASAVILVVAKGMEGGYDVDASGLAQNGWGDKFTGFSIGAALITEIVMTAIFLFVIVIATRKGAPAGTAPVAIGLCLTLIHLISIPVTNTSVNPARSIGPALFAGGDAIGQVWLFIVAPIIGAALGAVGASWLLANDAE
jgi:aquaporin Z